MIAIMSPALDPLFIGSRFVHLANGAVLFRSATAVREMFVIDQGQIQLIRHTVHGAKLVLQRAGPGIIVAEASAYSQTYHCDAITVEDCTLRAVPKSAFLSALAADPDLATVWAANLARGVQAARIKSEIRALPKVAERLDARLGEGNTLPPKGHWQDIANELGITREALYRELSRRRTGPKA